MPVESTPMKKKVRQSNFELLRIISMLMIILHHYAAHGHVYDAVKSCGIYPRIVTTLFFIGGPLGVNIFMLISSYFLIDTKFSIKRVLRIWFELFFYSVVFILIGKFCMHENYNYDVWLRAFFPVTFNAAWFALVYIFICFISPFMNMLIKNLNKKSYTAFMAALFMSLVGMSVLSFAAPQRFLFSFGGWFIFMYFMAGYIKRFSIKVLENKIVSMAVFAVSVAATCALLILFRKLGSDGSKFFEGHEYLPNNHEALFMFLAAVSIFMFFKNIDLSVNRVINFIAATAFGVYLIHDNNTLRPNIWSKWVKTGALNLSSAGGILLKGLLSALIIYIVCSVIDRARMILIERPIFSRLGRLDPLFARVDASFNFEEPYGREPEKSEMKNMNDENEAEPEKLPDSEIEDGSDSDESKETDKIPSTDNTIKSEPTVTAEERTDFLNESAGCRD